MMNRDDYYRNLCDSPKDYDRVIDWIAQSNKYAKNNVNGDTPEEFAINCVHACIRGVLFSDSVVWYSTGMCLAVRVSSNPKNMDYEKVMLAVLPRE